VLVGYGNPKEEIGGKQKKTSTDNFVDGLKPANEEWLGYKAVLSEGHQDVIHIY